MAMDLVPFKISRTAHKQQSNKESSLKSSSWGSYSFRTWRGQTTFFLQRRMALDLGAEPHPDACWRFQLDAANRTTASANRTDKLLKSTYSQISSNLKSGLWKSWTELVTKHSLDGVQHPLGMSLSKNPAKIKSARGNCQQTGWLRVSLTLSNIWVTTHLLM